MRKLPPAPPDPPSAPASETLLEEDPVAPAWLPLPPIAAMRAPNELVPPLLPAFAPAEAPLPPPPTVTACLEPAAAAEYTPRAYSPPLPPGDADAWPVDVAGVPPEPPPPACTSTMTQIAPDGRVQ